MTSRKSWGYHKKMAHVKHDEKRGDNMKKVFEANSQASANQVLLTFKNPDEAFAFQDAMVKGVASIKNNQKIEYGSWCMP